MEQGIQRYGKVTSNGVKNVNGALLVARGLPIVDMIEDIVSYQITRYSERKQLAGKWLLRKLLILFDNFPFALPDMPNKVVCVPLKGFSVHPFCSGPVGNIVIVIIIIVVAAARFRLLDAVIIVPCFYLKVLFECLLDCFR